MLAFLFHCNLYSNCTFFLSTSQIQNQEF